MVKIGVKGSELDRWAAENGIDLPPGVYETRGLADRGLLARVGNNEIILECVPDSTELSRIEQALATPRAGVYRIEQQSATFELAGPRARDVLAQMCSVNFQDAEPGRIIYTRLAGVSCGIIPLGREPQVTHRIWVDYTYAPYLWEMLTGIFSEYIQANQSTFSWNCSGGGITPARFD
ncbi:MAG: hypothetical protein ACREF9_16255 [Opitutaceae bacterium]